VEARVRPRARARVRARVRVLLELQPTPLLLCAPPCLRRGAPLLLLRLVRARAYG